MGRTLRYLGTGVVAVAIWMVISAELGWIPARVAEAGFKPVLLVGLACLGLGLLTGLLRPVRRRLRQARCVRCGAPTERGQTYCIDHLRATLNEYQDQMR